MTNLGDDLRERWLPSAEQMKAADALLVAGYDQAREGGERGVWTCHLLVNKRFGIWTAEVELVFLDGVFLTRETMLGFLYAEAKKYHVQTGKTLVGGYAWHPRVTEAGVWDDIGCQFPEGRR